MLATLTVDAELLQTAIELDAQNTKDTIVEAAPLFGICDFGVWRAGDSCAGRLRERSSPNRQNHRTHQPRHHFKNLAVLI